MEQKFLDQGCDVFMYESEIRMEGRIAREMSK